jgi:hypothetical protein
MTPKREDYPIAIGDDSGSQSLYCNIDNTKLLRSGKEFVCSKCGITYNPEMDNVRRGTMIETIDGIIDTSGGQVYNESLVAYPTDPNERYTRKKQKEYKGGIGELAKRGSINIRSYTESKTENNNDSR